MEEKDFSAVMVNGILPDPKQIDISNVIGDLWGDYVDSAESLLSDLEMAAMSLEAGENVEDNSAKIRRILHSLKGDSGICGLMDIYNLCHVAETAFEELGQTLHATDMVLKVKDWIEAAIQHTTTTIVKHC